MLLELADSAAEESARETALIKRSSISSAIGALGPVGAAALSVGMVSDTAALCWLLCALTLKKAASSGVRPGGGFSRMADTPRTNLRNRIQRIRSNLIGRELKTNKNLSNEESNSFKIVQIGKRNLKIEFFVQ